MLLNYIKRPTVALTQRHQSWKKLADGKLKCTENKLYLETIFLNFFLFNADIYKTTPAIISH